MQDICSVVAEKMMTFLPFEDWKARVIGLLESAEEYAVASQVYNFQAAYDDGLLPEDALTDFECIIGESFVGG